MIDRNVGILNESESVQHIEEDPVTGDCSLSFLRFLALWAVKLSCPLSVLELELSLSSSELDDEDELELLEESEANPVLVLMLIVSACLASSGSTSFKTRNHFLDNLGRPRTVLW